MIKYLWWFKSREKFMDNLLLIFRFLAIVPCSDSCCRCHRFGLWLCYFYICITCTTSYHLCDITSTLLAWYYIACTTSYHMCNITSTSPVWYYIACTTSHHLCDIHHLYDITSPAQHHITCVISHLHHLRDITSPARHHITCDITSTSLVWYYIACTTSHHLHDIISPVLQETTAAINSTSTLFCTTSAKNIQNCYVSYLLSAVVLQ